MTDLKIRIVQVNENAYIVQELGSLFFFPKWWTWQVHSLYSSWDEVHETEKAARNEIERTLTHRKLEADAKTFKPKVVWP